jgi:predicted nucleic acid-binding protein
MIVVDTNVIAYLYLTGERSAQAEQALVRDPDWAAPLLWRSEFRSVLALYVRRALLSLQDAQEIMDEATGLMQDREYETTSHRVLSWVAESTCSAYDCEFVALAQDLGVPLVTVDRQILGQFPTLAISLDAFAGTPSRRSSGF